MPEMNKGDFTPGNTEQATHSTFVENIEVLGARVHNLRNIDVVIPRNKLVVITGLSGSGKSSLAFDTIYAEGQRRYIETFSAYARQFIGNLERPDVDKINGLSPVVAIEQKTSGRNPRSTVGTITEIYDFLRLLFSRVATAYSHTSGQPMVRHTESQIIALVTQRYLNHDVLVLSPLVKGRKGHYRELFDTVRKQGFLKVRVDGDIREVSFGMQLDRYKVHDIELVVDRLRVGEKTTQRLSQSVQTAMRQGKGSLLIMEEKTGKVEYFSRMFMDPVSGISYDEPEPNTFSFNSPYGACPKCNGLGLISKVDMDRIIPDSKRSIRKGGLSPLGEFKPTWIFKQVEGIVAKYGYNLDTPLEDLPEEAINTLLHGTHEMIRVKNEYLGITTTYNLNFEGIINFILSQDLESNSAGIKKWAANFMNKIECPECHGTRLKKESLHFKIGDKNIGDLSNIDLLRLYDWSKIAEDQLDERKRIVAHEILREIQNRIDFLLEVGLGYLTLNRPAASLSGGESQRIRLATQIGSQLVGVLYILDEPSIGLHQRDNKRLIKSLKDLRDLGNTVIVVEHDKDMIINADHVIDIGPGAGRLGGKIVAQGSPAQMTQCRTLTCDYISGRKCIEIPAFRRSPNGAFLRLKGATGNNLNNIDIDIPLGVFICVTGVSGSGKSTLINETLYPILSQHLYRSDMQPLPYKSIEGIEQLDKIIEVDQSPIGKTPRSNPATYTGVFDEIRKLFHVLPESKIRGYKPGRFSFNVSGGRCESCKGAGVKVIEMNFLPNVHVLCDDCQGKRYNRETLEVRYKGKSISDVLDMTIDQSVDFFENIHMIVHKLRAIQEVGLGYIALGQQSTTLSGGEAQRVKLATELSRKDTGKTLYILDEPTTGLHIEDVKVLLEVLTRLIDKGNTIIVIEHNMEVIKTADYIIDLGPEGGDRGGTIVAEGTPEQVAKTQGSFTGEYLKQELDAYAK
ncbi:MAG: excinuclease ABC subunit UvrA [Bacteroidales bacterium]|nr:excinuclease ABC subunit UvrA [Bacteroidales bacterium]MDZ4204530.1 excinuclease ABC subunit UvrA [Bacteroidales bacterium]